MLKIGIIYKIVYFILDILYAIFFSLKKSDKNLKEYDNIIIKPDNLGDVVLFCAVLKQFKPLDKNTLLMVRSNFFDIVKLLVPEVEVQSLPSDEKLTGKKDIKAAAEKMRSFRSQRLIIPVVSRNFYNTDIYAILLRSVFSIAPDHDGQNSPLQIGKLIQHSIYDQIIPSFSSERRTTYHVLSRIFQKNLVDEKIKYFERSLFTAERKYFILSPYTTDAKRDIPRTVIDKIIQELTELNVLIMVVGSVADRSKVSFEASKNVIDLVGSTTIAELFSLVQDSLGVICAETGTLQIGSYLDKNILAFVGGGHYGRYFDGESGSSIVLAQSANQACFHCGWKCSRKNIQRSAYYPCIEEIEFKDKFKIFIKKVMKNGPNK